MTKIIPTVGRKLWYYPMSGQANDDESMLKNVVDGLIQPLDATVVAVFSDDVVNVVIFDIHGYVFSRRNVKLVNDGERAPSMGGYVTWMPYQVAQAKFSEDLSRVPSGRVFNLEEILKDATSFTAETREEVEDIPNRVIKAKEYDDVMHWLDEMVVPKGVSLAERFGWAMVNFGKTKPVGVTSADVVSLQSCPTDNLTDALQARTSFVEVSGLGTFHRYDIERELNARGYGKVDNMPEIPRPMLKYDNGMLYRAWDSCMSLVTMPDGLPFSRRDIDTELRYRGDKYGMPRDVDACLQVNTKSA